ncbi:hypothetical protein B0J11DRAFT_601147, partial [Dendryphion nanum]
MLTSTPYKHYPLRLVKMVSQIEPIANKRVKCTYEDCDLYFPTVGAMISHKKNSEEHDYCQKCDKDFNSFEELAQHKAFTPDVHQRACRVCGDEFKSVSGLKRHIELSHKVNQKLSCIGCNETFHRASLMVEHLEFGHCPEISAGQFHAHIVHKQLVSELLRSTPNGGSNMVRFLQKQEKHDAAIDNDEHEGGINIMDDNNDEAQDIGFQAIEPDIPTSACELAEREQGGAYPPLPSQKLKACSTSGGFPSVFDEIAERLDRMSMSGLAPPSVAVTSATISVAGDFPPPATNQATVWSGKSASTLFPKAKSFVAGNELIQLEQVNEDKDFKFGPNVMNTRFWDPSSVDWSPERFYNSMESTYTCPFPCEQAFKVSVDLANHIRYEHRITRMRCPTCLKQFNSATALVSHCESHASKCPINQSDDFGTFLDRLTGGFLSVKEKIRPDHMHNPAVLVRNPITRRLEPYHPPQASYLQYTVTKPPDYKEPRKTTEIGG